MATLQTWRDYISWSLDPVLGNARADVWPWRAGMIIRHGDGKPRLDVMNWNVPLVIAGRRPGTKVTKRVTNVRNLSMSELPQGCASVVPSQQLDDAECPRASRLA